MVLFGKLFKEKNLMYYRECPLCGSNLDPGEKCDCQDAKKNREELIRTLLIRQPDGQLALREAV